MGNRLAVAAQRADALTKELRRLNWPAYQYHDRYTSIVTVGNYKSPGTPLANGEIDFSSDIKKIIATFSAGAPDPNDPLQSQVQSASRTLSTQGMNAQGVAPKRINVGTHDAPIWIPLDPQPQVVQIPKRPISMSSGGVE